MNTESLVRRFYELYQSRDKSGFEAQMSDDFTFTSPYDDHINKKVYFERCWLPGDKLVSFKITHILAQGDEVFIRYHAKWTDNEATNVEFFTCKSGKIASVNVYFGNSQLAAD